MSKDSLPFVHGAWHLHASFGTALRYALPPAPSTIRFTRLPLQIHLAAAQAQRYETRQMEEGRGDGHPLTQPRPSPLAVGATPLAAGRAA